MIVKLYSDDIPDPADIEMAIKVAVDEKIYNFSQYETANNDAGKLAGRGSPAKKIHCARA
jgi:hypothetical protein